MVTVLLEKCPFESVVLLAAAKATEAASSDNKCSQGYYVLCVCAIPVSDEVATMRKEMAAAASAAAAATQDSTEMGIVLMLLV